MGVSSPPPLFFFLFVPDWSKSVLRDWDYGSLLHTKFFTKRYLLCWPSPVCCKYDRLTGILSVINCCTLEGKISVLKKLVCDIGCHWTNTDHFKQSLANTTSFLTLKFSAVLYLISISFSSQCLKISSLWNPVLNGFHIESAWLVWLDQTRIFY